MHYRKFYHGIQRKRVEQTNQMFVFTQHCIKKILLGTKNASWAWVCYVGTYTANNH